MTRNESMKFLYDPPHFLFFTGKGGGGKTSLACATALKLAESGKKVLLVSTDPASNVNQVFEMPIGCVITPIKHVPGLDALEINPQEAAQAYRAHILAQIPPSTSDEILKDVKERLSGACTTEIAAFDTFTEILTDKKLQSNYDHIIFDTAPTGHTLRLLQLPGAWDKFLDEGKGNASCLGPLAGLEKQRIQYKEAVKALTDEQMTRLVLVARPQSSSIMEANRTHEELLSIGIKNQYFVINAIFPTEEVHEDTLASEIVRRETQARTNLPHPLQSLPIDLVYLKPFNLIGLESLRHVFDLENNNIRDDTHPFLTPKLSRFDSLVNEIAQQGRGLIMLMGKGGVGKTTLASALALKLATRGYSVLLTTSDPASHLAQTIDGSMKNLTVSRIDPREETKRYREHVLSTKGKNMSDEEKALLYEDLLSPCTEEIAVFGAFSRAIREAQTHFVVIDTAPTGHTLLLLDATGAYHRQIARHLGEGAHFTTPLMDLQDPNKTKILIVALAETTPVLEAANLQEDLRRAGIEPWAWIINNSISLAHPTTPLLIQLACHEIPHIEKVATHYSHRLAVVPQQIEEPVGIERLLQLGK